MSFLEGKVRTSVLHNYSLRSSSSNTPQKNGSTEGKLPNRTALREVNNLSSLPNQPKSATKHCMVKAIIKNTGKTENTLLPVKDVSSIILVS